MLVCLWGEGRVEQVGGDMEGLGEKQSKTGTKIMPIRHLKATPNECMRK